MTSPATPDRGDRLAGEVTRVLNPLFPGVPMQKLDHEIERTISGETVAGYRVAAYRETHPEHGDKYGHAYSEHWSTPSPNPRVKVERLFAESDFLALLSERDEALAGWKVCRESLTEQAGARRDPTMPVLVPEVIEAWANEAEASYAMAETAEERRNAHGLSLLVEWRRRQGADARCEMCGGAGCVQDGSPESWCYDTCYSCGGSGRKAGDQGAAPSRYEEPVAWAAEMIWERFAPDHEVDFSQAHNRAEYLFAAKTIVSKLFGDQGAAQSQLREDVRARSSEAAEYLDECLEIIRGWSGSAFVAGQKMSARLQADAKAHLYLDLCRAGNLLWVIRDEAAGLPSPPEQGEG